MSRHIPRNTRLTAIGRWGGEIVRRLRRRARRAGPLACLLISLGACTLLFVGCYELAGRGWMQEGPPPAAESVGLKVDREVRVRLMGRRPLDRVWMEVRSRFDVKDSTGGRVILGGQAPFSGWVQAGPGGGILLCGLAVPAGDIVMVPTRDASFVVDHVTHKQKETYRGAMRVQRLGEGVSLTNQVDVESYLRGVLRGELPAAFHFESFKAQCVAARTYVLYQKSNGGADREFDVFDDEGSQMYIGVRGEDAIAIRAADQTLGEVCTYPEGGSDTRVVPAEGGRATRDTLFCTYYSSACGGQTQHVNNVKTKERAVPPLAGGVVCDDCYLARHYRWGPVELGKDELTRRIVSRYPTVASLGAIKELRVKERTPDGRIVRIEMIGGNGRNETLIGEDFRLSAGGHTLKSTRFQIESRERTFVFYDGKGFGHGMGLCQYGMETKARRGMDYRRILSFYYPGSEVKRVYP